MIRKRISILTNKTRNDKMIVRTVMKMENLYHESHLSDMKQLKSFVIIGGKSKEWQKDLSNQLEKEMNRILSFLKYKNSKNQNRCEYGKTNLNIKNI